MRLARPAFSGWLPEDHRFKTAAWPLTVSLLVTIHLALLSPAGQSLPLKNTLSDASCFPSPTPFVYSWLCWVFFSAVALCALL